MTAITFDSLKYFEILKDAGVPEPQAKAQIDIMQEVTVKQNEGLLKDVANKGDLKNEVSLAKEELRKEILQMKYDILKWMIGLLFAQSALIVGVIASIK